MTKEAYKEGLTVFLDTFSNIKATERTQKVWFTLLQDISDAEFLFAVTKICREAKGFYPTDNFAAMVLAQIKSNSYELSQMRYRQLERIPSTKLLGSGMTKEQEIRSSLNNIFQGLCEGYESTLNPKGA